MSVIPLLSRINEIILNPIIVLLFAVALLVFFWGIVKFIAKNSDTTAREEGKKTMIWGIVGMFIMVAVYGIIRIILATFGIDRTGQYPF